jgi:hypothetical protein
MVITAILMVPLVAAMFTVTHTLGDTTSRIDQSNGAALFSSYFAPDIQNVDLSNPTPIVIGGTESAAVCGPTARAVALLILTPSGSVSYWQNGTVLYRRTCSGGTATGGARLVRYIQSGTLSFQCSPNCANTTWQSITGTVTQYNPNDPTNVAKQYSTTVEATRRVS